MGYGLSPFLLDPLDPLDLFLLDPLDPLDLFLLDPLDPLDPLDLLQLFYLLTDVGLICQYDF
jgi:hypothetical protein